MSKKTVVPKLRFFAFRGGENWKETTLGSICDYWNGASHENGITENGEYCLISLNSIDIDGNLKHDMKRLSYTDNSLQQNDLVMVLSDVAHGNFLGLTDLIPNDRFVLNQRMAGLRIKKSNTVNNVFLRTFINNNQRYFKEKGQGSSQLNLSKSAVTNFPVFFPLLKEEQQKIADCISSLENIITAENKKLKTLKTHKKGLMQKLFPAEGKTMPEWRFPEFRDSGEWEISPFMSFVKLYRGSSPRPIQNYLTKKGGVNWIKIGDTKNADGYKIHSVEEQITCEGAKKSRFVKVGELILANSMSYGKTYEVEIDGYIYDGWFVLREYEEHFNKKFLLQQLNSGYLQKQYTSLSAGGIVLNISSDIVYSTLLMRPEHNEQQKIADFLSSVDNLITAQAKKVEALNQHKKGLLQGLFPSAQEVME